MSEPSLGSYIYLDLSLNYEDSLYLFLWDQLCSFSGRSFFYMRETSCCHSGDHTKVLKWTSRYLDDLPNIDYRLFE